METLAAFFSKHFFIIVWVTTLSVFGAVTNYIRKARAGKIERFSISELIGDITISFFLGVVTFLICKGAGVDDYITAGIIGLVSHMGTRGIVIVEDALSQIMPKLITKFFGTK